ncbi:MAG: sigma 54 modulation/S30EA ribosomal C-terminal domain-containing protein [Acidobacteriota bacterium]
MSIKFTSKSVKLPGALKGYVEKSLKNIEKISGDIINSEIVVNEEKLGYKIEISMKTKLNNYHVFSTDPILKQALRNAINSIKIQTKKNKEKLKNDKRKGKNNFLKGFFKTERIEPVDRDSNKTERIIVSDNYSRKPITVEEAIFFLKDSGENAYMFQNVDSENIAVVYLNKNKTISLIDANIEK